MPLLKLNAVWLPIALCIIAGLLLLGGCVLDATPTAQHRPPATPTTIPTIASTQSISSPTPQYDRDEWGGWVDLDGDCLNTRHEVLIEESLSEPVLEDCKVVSGLWVDPWTGNSFDEAGQLDIDHHVPLANVHRSGGSGSDAGRRCEFSSDFANLNAVSRTVNHTKGIQGPDEWCPPDDASHCEYAKQWEVVKTKYELSMTESEHQAVTEMLDTCTLKPPTPTLATAIPPVTPTVASTPVAPIGTHREYESGEDAEAAGEQRIRGSQGEGQGACLISPLNTAQLDILDQCDGCRRHESKS